MPEIQPDDQRALRPALIPTIDMKAHHPGQEFWTSTARLYKADGDGIVHDVRSTDILEMKATYGLDFAEEIATTAVSGAGPGIQSIRSESAAADALDMEMRLRTGQHADRTLAPGESPVVQGAIIDATIGNRMATENWERAASQSDTGVPIYEVPADQGPGGTEPPVEPVLGAPVNIDVPYVSGTGTVGETLSCTMGNWEGEPTSYAYDWKSKGGGLEETIAEGPDYVVQSKDVGKSITCTVEAANSAGRTKAPPSNAVEVTG
jgi:hypothetical protein